MLPFSLLISNGPFAISSRSQFGWQRAQLKETAIGRVVERASGLTPELPVHVELVPPLLVPPLLVPPLLVPPLLRFQALVPPLLRLQALVPMVQRQPCRVCYFLDCSWQFRLRPLWWLQTSSGFYPCRPPALSSRCFFSRFFAAPEDPSQ